ncbi:hypothetical protein [Rhodopila sp.]|uniref:hypothetical protein n=1 Tax=Rhodopila sp. TaxID=2480087 RepID=UPI003D14857B
MPSAVAVRMRRFRQRRAEGAVVIRMVLDAGGVADLVDLGWLRPGASRKDVPRALAEMMDTAFNARVMPPRRVDTPVGPTLGEVWERHQVG